VLVYRSPSTPTNTDIIMADTSEVDGYVNQGPTNTDIIMADTSEVDGYVNQGKLLSSFSCLHYINI